jgi:hypothetical protein
VSAAAAVGVRVVCLHTEGCWVPYKSSRLASVAQYLGARHHARARHTTAEQESDALNLQTV